VSAADELLAAARSASVDQLKLVLSSSKKGFLDTFSSFIKPEDLARLDELFERAFKAKVAHFAAKTPEQAQEQIDIYEASMETIETIGDDYEIVGKAKAGAIVRSFAHQVIAGAFAIAGAVLQAGLGILVPGIGALIGAGANVGIQHVVDYFLGD
jgi:hypothetical protein